MKKKLFTIIAMLAVVLVGCNKYSKQEDAINKYYKTSEEFVLGQNFAKFLGAKIDASIKVLNCTDTVYQYEKEQYDAVMQHTEEVKKFNNRYNTEMIFGSYWADWDKIAKYRQEFKDSTIQFEKILQNIDTTSTAIYAYEYQCKQTTITKLNGEKNTDVDTVYYYLTENLEVLKKEFDRNVVNLLKDEEYTKNIKSFTK